VATGDTYVIVVDGEELRRAALFLRGYLRLVVYIIPVAAAPAAGAAQLYFAEDDGDLGDSGGDREGDLGGDRDERGELRVSSSGENPRGDLG
jgi:hypothetical protein